MFKAFYIDNCGFSKKTFETLHPYQSVKLAELILCPNYTHDDPDFIEISKTYSSFPKVFFKINDKYVFIGGNSELQTLLIEFQKLKENPNHNISENKYINKKIICQIYIDLITNYSKQI